MPQRETTGVSIGQWTGKLNRACLLSKQNFQETNRNSLETLFLRLLPVKEKSQSKLDLSSCEVRFSKGSHELVGRNWMTSGECSSHVCLLRDVFQKKNELRLSATCSKFSLSLWDKDTVSLDACILQVWCSVPKKQITGLAVTDFCILSEEKHIRVPALLQENGGLGKGKWAPGNNGSAFSQPQGKLILTW